jgi:DnaK suppressor protein
VISSVGSRRSAEQAVQRENEEVLVRLDESSMREIAAIRGALDRLASGRYGTCIECGEPIAEARLSALPITDRCIDCA